MRKQNIIPKWTVLKLSNTKLYTYFVWVPWNLITLQRSITTYNFCPLFQTRFTIKQKNMCTGMCLELHMLKLLRNAKNVYTTGKLQASRQQCPQLRILYTFKSTVNTVKSTPFPINQVLCHDNTWGGEDAASPFVTSALYACLDCFIPQKGLLPIGKEALVGLDAVLNLWGR